MTVLNTLKAAAVALALGGALVAIPAQAATPTFGFMLNLGGGGGVVLDFDDDDNDFFELCLTEKQVIKALNNKGYKNVDIVKDAGGDKVWVIARKGSHWYQMRVDTCSGKVDKVKEIHPVDHDDDDIHFQLKFTF